jgi:putative Mg2+ transporter-C (MgtC) family protein
MEEILSIEPLTIEGCLVAILCGFIIGIERQWFGKPAGIRTSILVCTGVYTFISIGTYYQPSIGGVRVLGSVVTGVGFLGAGLMMSKGGSITGVTSASTIWMLAAIGCLVGFKNYTAAISTTLLTIFVLLGINLLEKIFKKLTRGVHKKFMKDEY